MSGLVYSKVCLQILIRKHRRDMQSRLKYSFTLYSAQVDLLWADITGRSYSMHDRGRLDTN